MKLTEQQAIAVDKAYTTSLSPGAVMILAGFAGTGKSTTLKAIIERIGNVCLMATTGKAARRAAHVTGHRAQTCHRFIYTPVETPGGGVAFLRKVASEDDVASLFIVDECSMMTQDVFQDLMISVTELHGSLLLVGDSFQLPPVQPDAAEPWSVFTHIQADHKVFLTEVHRQALDSPVLACATKLREATWSDTLPIIKASLREVTSPSAWMLNKMRAKEDSAVIAHRNATRYALNKAIRYMNGRPVNVMQEGEPLLVKRNNPHIGLSNGDITTFTGFCGTQEFGDKLLRLTRVGDVVCALKPSAVFGDEPDLPFRAQAILKATKGIPYLMANLGYVLTCHNAQGSEWPSVDVVIEPSLRAMPEEERVRWCYTAITRASTECVFSVVE